MVKTTKEVFGLSDFDLQAFSEALLLDERRETLAAMTQEQLMVVRHAFRYGQLTEKKGAGK